MSTYMWTSPTPGTLASGRPVSIGTVVELTKEDLASRHNARLVERGDLAPAGTKPAKTKTSNKKATETAQSPESNAATADASGEGENQ